MYYNDFHTQLLNVPRQLVKDRRISIIHCATKSECDNFLFVENIYPKERHFLNTQISIHEDPSKIVFNSTSDNFVFYCTLFGLFLANFSPKLPPPPFFRKKKKKKKKKKKEKEKRKKEREKEREKEKEWEWESKWDESK